MSCRAVVSVGNETSLQQRDHRVPRGGDCLEDCDKQTQSTLERRMGYVTDSAAAERSDGYRLGSAFFLS